MPSEGQTITNEKGASQSFIKADFDCIPPIVLKLLAQCLGFGRRKYGKENWKGIPVEDNLSHAMNHINEWRLGDRSEPHLVNAMARLSFALWHAVNDKDQPSEYIHPDESLPSQAVTSYWTGQPKPEHYKPLECSAVLNTENGMLREVVNGKFTGREFPPNGI